MKNFFSILIVTVFLILVNISNAQWVQTNGCGSVVTSLSSNGNYIFAGTWQGVYRSTDNGNNWVQTAMNGPGVFSLTVVGNYIFAGTVNLGVYRSSDNGNNWMQTDLYTWVHFLSFNGNYIFAGTSSGVYLSTNYGTNWNQTALNINVLSLAFSGANIFAGTTSYGVYLSTNIGTNWNQTALNNKNVLSLAVSGTKIFAGTNQYGVYLSTNNGNYWSPTSLNDKNVKSLANSGSNIFAGTENYGVFYSTNNGNIWFEKNQGFYQIPTVNALLINNDYILAGTLGSAVWKRSLSEIVEIKSVSFEVPLVFNLSQNYPNPFNPVTKIKFDIPKSTNIRLTVYDILGKEIFVLSDEKVSPGTYETEFNGENYPSGIYFYRLETSDFVQTNKMILMK